MNFFDEAALRLKQQLKVTENKQVAEALGMTGNAWTMRKRRDAFPEMELRALAQQRPELGIDVEYVLTGGPSVHATAHDPKKGGDQLQAYPATPDDKRAEYCRRLGRVITRYLTASELQAYGEHLEAFVAKVTTDRPAQGLHDASYHLRLRFKMPSTSPKA